MNIFYLDSDITKCAQAHCDKHVNKMILESAQLLASAIHVIDPQLAQDTPDIYRLTHKNHPCAVWVRQSAYHYIYLLDLMEELNKEAQYRYGHTKDHVSLVKAREWKMPHLPFTLPTEPPKCMPDDLKQIDNTVEAYREYYKRDKHDIAAWTKRESPVWFRP